MNRLKKIVLHSMFGSWMLKKDFLLSKFTCVSLCSELYKAQGIGRRCGNSSVMSKEQITPLLSGLPILIPLAVPLELFLCRSVNGLVNLWTTLLIVLNLYNLIKHSSRIRSESWGKICASGLREGSRGRDRGILRLTSEPWHKLRPSTPWPSPK